FSALNERIRKAAPRGTAVSASPTLWIRSASSAIEPLRMKTTICAAAVAPRTSRLIRTAWTASREAVIGAVAMPVGAVVRVPVIVGVLVTVAVAARPVIGRAVLVGVLARVGVT